MQDLEEDEAGSPNYRVQESRTPPASPVQSGEEINSSDEEINSTDESVADDVHWQHVCAPLENPTQPIRPPNDEEANPPSLSEVMLTVLDWFSSHKQTYTATSDLYRILALVVPPGTTLGTFAQMRAILDRHRLDACETFDACQRGCIVYKDFTGVFQGHQYSRLTECPVCGCHRFAGMGAHKRPCHTVYFFRIVNFLRDMFSRADMATHLDHRYDDSTPASSIKRSHGYREKILQNAHLNNDHRNQAIILSSDGIPYFGAAGKHSRGAWPLLARLASLPDGLWDRYEYAHLYGLEAQEHYYTDIETGNVHRKRRDITTLSGILMLIAEDLHKAYYDGVTCQDNSQPSNSSERVFQCKVCLLLVVGDYPALAKITGFSHSGNFHCHWCMQNSMKDMAVSRHACGDFRRWLPRNSPQRNAGGNFRTNETRGPPPLREHDSCVYTGMLASCWTGRAKDHPATTHGISHWCPLVEAPLFDVVWDVCGDLMHAVKYYNAHVVKCMKGETRIAMPTSLTLIKNPKSEGEKAENKRRQEVS